MPSTFDRWCAAALFQRGDSATGDTRTMSVSQTSHVDEGLDHTAQTADIRVLGPLEVRGPAGTLDIRHGLPRALMSMFLVRLGEVVETDVLVDELWPDRLPANPSNALQVQVSYVRRQLRPLDELVRLERHGFGYRLVARPDCVDAIRFGRMVERVATMLGRPSTTAEVAEALSAIDRALGWWRGPAYVDAAHLRSVESEQHRLDLVRLVALEQRGVLLDRLGRHAEAAAWLEPLAEVHPLREGLWEALIGALYRDGRQAEALRANAAARARLND
jgi:DNA-binding SARP family transcriptional activator